MEGQRFGVSKTVEPATIHTFGPAEEPEEPSNAEIRRYRTLFVSDLHLGTKHCRADMFLDFLKHTECETLYLVGDIVDNWALKRHWQWRQAHNDVIQKLLRKARKGTRIVYIPGNHDEQFRDFCGQEFGAVAVRRRDVHTAADGKRYLILHGDEFDGVVLYANWLAHLGDVAYTAAIRVNTLFNAFRRRFGLPYWSLSAYLKRRVKRAVEFIGNFEAAVVREARKEEVDGIVCGHIHTAEFREIDGIIYCNDGDWVESCTALGEHADGRLELIDWSAEMARRKAVVHAHPDRDRRLAPAG